MNRPLMACYYPVQAKPQGFWPGDILVGMLCFALPSRRFRSSWFSVIAHSGQSIYFAILILGLTLGIA
jgi:hypothetical protein